MEATRVLNPTELFRALGLFLPAGEVIELRALGVDRGHTASGYFDDRQAAAQAAASLSGAAEGVYVTLNPVDGECLARANNRVRTFARTTTTDTEITRRRWLFVDIDSVRPRGVSATDAEQRAALAKAQEVRAFLRGRGWPDPVVASSGNGAHLLYRLNAPNTPEAAELLQHVLQFLGERFSDPSADVDQTTFNASRLIRLYGTLARKGDQAGERIHRIASVLVSPEGGEPLTLDSLRSFQREHPLAAPNRPARPTGRVGPIGQPLPPRVRNLDTSGLDIVRWFQSHDHYGHAMQDDRGQHTVRCPWEEEHSAGDGANDSDTTVWDGSDGRLPGFRCLHSHCMARRLREVMAEWGDAELFGARLRASEDYPLTDEGNAQRLVDKWGPHLRHCPELGGWMWWDNGCWERDADDKGAVEAAADCIADVGREALTLGDGERRKEMLKFFQNSQKWERTRAVVSRAAKVRELHTRACDYDANPYLLNCRNGVVDLRDGSLRDHAPDTHCSRIASHAYDREAQCPRWDRFLQEVFNQDEPLISFIRRAVGYSLTGSTKEQVLFFCHGFGANGKTTFLETLTSILGTYAGAGAPGLLLESKGDRHPTEVADLRGKRMVVCSEVGEGRRFAEEQVKRLTGSERLTARLMRQDFFSFNPTHKLWLAANHKPLVRGTDHAIWRRLPLIPFEVTFKDVEVAAPGEPVKDKSLSEKLLAEAPGILAWAVRGAVEWNRAGLLPPSAVIDATRSYREEQDLLGTFLAEECMVAEDAVDTAGALYEAYRRWAEASGEHAVTQRAFGLALTERGFTRHKASTYRWRGLRALSEAEKLAREADG